MKVDYCCSVAPASPRGKCTLMEFCFYPRIQRLLHPDSTSSMEPELCTQIIVGKGAKWAKISYWKRVIAQDPFLAPAL